MNTPETSRDDDLKNIVENGTGGTFSYEAEDLAADMLRQENEVK